MLSHFRIAQMIRVNFLKGARSSISVMRDLLTLHCPPTRVSLTSANFSGGEDRLCSVSHCTYSTSTTTLTLGAIARFFGQMALYRILYTTRTSAYAYGYGGAVDPFGQLRSVEFSKREEAQVAPTRQF